MYHKLSRVGKKLAIFPQEAAAIAQKILARRSFILSTVNVPSFFLVARPYGDTTSI